MTKLAKVVCQVLMIVMLVSTQVVHCFAGIASVAYFRLGDSDPDAVVGQIGSDVTLDSVGGNDLTRRGSPIYSSDVPFSHIGGESNAFSMFFNGSAFENYWMPERVLDLEDNFGIELFVKPSFDNTDSGIIYDGKDGSTGFGIFQEGGMFRAMIGSNPGVLFGSVPVQFDKWVHLALVRDNGLTTFYVDGIAVATSLEAPQPGSVPFVIGGSVGSSDGFSGFIDEVRLFTFSSGDFVPENLLIFQIPEPNALALTLISAAIGICYSHAWRKRRNG